MGLKTYYFQQSIGVFEGGGVKGAAFAGAYSVATKAKINFIGNIGTSAGSIAAALISAGFTPDELLNAMQKPFSDFIAKAIPPRSLGTKIKYKFAKAIGGTIGKIGKLQYALGLHSSKNIESWMEEILRKKLQISGRTVYFKDLPKNLVIIATNLRTGSYKIWSTKRTPDASVSFAVRCSCTIPFFFQPVESEEGFYVDGALIANLPLFLIKELEIENHTPVLCFRLIQNHENAKLSAKNGIDLIKLLLPPLLDGTSEIQLNMSEYRQVIDIPTGSISSINFNIKKEDIETLITNGKSAMEGFLNNEQALIVRLTQDSVKLRKFREGLLEQTASIIAESSSTIHIMAGDLSWLKEIHLSLLDASLRGVSIKIICENYTNKEYDDAIEAAMSIGARIFKSSKAALLKGTCIDLFTENAKMIAIEETPFRHGRLYLFPNDSGFIKLIRNSFNNIWDESLALGDGNKPVLRQIAEKILVDTLKSKVPLYRNCNISMQTVDVNKLKPLARYLEKLKLNRVEQLDKVLVSSGLQNAAHIVNCPWIITPPIIEKIKNEDFVIIDGTHRVFYYKLNDRHEIRVILVENNDVALPAKPINWDVITIKTEKIPRNTRYIDYDEALFRPIDNAF